MCVGGGPQTLTSMALLGLIVLKGLGYLTFRGSNSQKDQFRRDPSHPSVSRLQTIKTERGRQLLVSGWWGIARHINYFGDWIMAWSWCLPCSFSSIVPYFYVVYFGVLLGAF
jgi:Delta14-sterol reductase